MSPLTPAGAQLGVPQPPVMVTPSPGVSLCTHPGHHPGTPRLMNHRKKIGAKTKPCLIIFKQFLIPHDVEYVDSFEKIHLILWDSLKLHFDLIGKDLSNSRDDIITFEKM